jgi:nitrite reductase/ring-hydroxylating ferredoxin subunit
MDPAEAVWTRVADRGEPAEGRPQSAQRSSAERVLLVRSGGKLFATQANCGHMRFPLGDSKVNETVLTCPMHKAQFDLRNGAVVRAPQIPGLLKVTKMGKGILAVPVEPLRTYDIEERADGVYVRPK